MAKPKPNVYLTPTGSLRVQFDDKMTNYGLRWRLQQAHGVTAMSLTTTRTDRDLLESMLKEYKRYVDTCFADYIVSDEAADSIMEAIEEAGSIPPPILPLTPYEKLGMIDDLQLLQARDTFGEPSKKLKPYIIKNNTYKFEVGNWKYQKEFTRNKLHHKEKTQTTYTRIHSCQLEGNDTTFTFKDENNVWWSFREHPEFNTDLDESKVWEFFVEPDIPTVKEVYPEEYKKSAQMLDTLESLNPNPNFKYFPGQREFFSRFGILNSAACCIQTGGGKTLSAFTLYYQKNAKRALFIVPRGTSVGEEGKNQKFDETPQWFAEAAKFAPDAPVHKLFSKDDYYKLLGNNGKLPTGIFITYPHAMFNNDGAFENVPKSRAWKAQDGEEKFCSKYNIKYDELSGINYVPGIGQERNGILCLATPSLATLCGPQFDMVIIDEAHLMCGLETNTTKGVLRLQPKYRYAMTATPIPNMCYNIFPIMGWLCNKDWRLDRRRTPRWPYGLEELSRFKTAHVSKERDLTAEEDARTRGDNPPSTKDSPVISQSPILLNILRKTVAYMGLEDINPDIVNCDIRTHKVPMGKQQHALYAHYLQRKNIPHENPLARAGVQQQWLRGLCADPATVSYNNVPGMIIESNYNPKTMAIVDIIAQALLSGEQILFVGARNGQIYEIANRLEQAGVSYSLINGDRKRCKSQSSEAASFKQGRTMVMLMNIYCAQAFSFENCSRMIIGSLEWSYGKFAQACGRIHRMNSPKDCEVNVVLHKNSIEELLFEKVATKADAATVMLKGEHLKKNYKTLDENELFAQHFQDFSSLATHEVMDESGCEKQWPELMLKMRGELTPA